MKLTARRYLISSMAMLMKKFPLMCILALCCAAPALAQTGARYRSDNFDMQSGVRIESVPTTATLPPVKSPLKTVRPTAKAVSVQSAVASRPKALVYTRPLNIGKPASNVLNGFTTGDSGIDAYIVEAGTRNGVDPVLLYAQMHQESSFKARAVSPKGARGLMQLMPATAMRFGVTNIFDQRQNIEGGARYMRFLLDTFDGDVALALAGYNAGEGAVLKYGRRVPPYRETQEYVRRIRTRYEMLRDPETARNARNLLPSQVAQVQAEQPESLSMYERNVYAVRLPDGRLQLVSQ